jgi:hypothetical protein
MCVPHCVDGVVIEYPYFSGLHEITLPRGHHDGLVVRLDRKMQT